MKINTPKSSWKKNHYLKELQFLTPQKRGTSNNKKEVEKIRRPKTSADWQHTGIITKVNNEYIETIEGNTNQGGSSNGNGVYRRIRNFDQTIIDVVSIDGF